MMISLVSVLDKRLLTVHFPSVRSFIFILGTIWLVQGILIVTLVVLLSGMPDIGYMMLACVAGATTAFGLSFYFWGLTFEEVSRGSPIFGTAPLFSALLSILFLSEELAGIQWMGIITIVLGASLLSFKPTPGRREFMGTKGFGIFLAGALFSGSGLVLNKQASFGLPIVPLFGCYSFGIASAFIINSIRPFTLRQVVGVVRDRSGSTETSSRNRGPSAAFTSRRNSSRPVIFPAATLGAFERLHWATSWPFSSLGRMATSGVW